MKIQSRVAIVLLGLSVAPAVMAASDSAAAQPLALKPVLVRVVIDTQAQVYSPSYSDVFRGQHQVIMKHHSGDLMMAFGNATGYSGALAQQQVITYITLDPADNKSLEKLEFYSPKGKRLAKDSSPCSKGQCGLAVSAQLYRYEKSDKPFRLKATYKNNSVRESLFFVKDVRDIEDILNP